MRFAGTLRGFTGTFEGSWSLGAETDVDPVTVSMLKGIKSICEYGVDLAAGRSITCTVTARPSAWCPWFYEAETKTLSWNQRESSEAHVAWIHYVIDKILVPRGVLLNRRYALDGEVRWRSNDGTDTGTIRIIANDVEIVRHGDE